MDIASRSALAIRLSRLRTFEKGDISLEQYVTDPEIAATVLWDAYMKGRIRDKLVTDLGAGSGILGIGALLLGARVIFVEKGQIDALSANLQGFKGFEIVQKDVRFHSMPCDVVIENPPFGTRQRHEDIVFLEKACSLAPIVYSFHKTATVEHVVEKARGLGFTTSSRHDFNFPLKQTYLQHRKSIQRIAVSCLCFEKNI